MKQLSHFKRAVALVLLGLPLFFTACGDDNATGSDPTWHWSALGDGLTGTVNAVEEYGGKLYAGGTITGGAKVLNGGQWESIGPTPSDVINGYVYDLIRYDNRLVVTGSFTSIGALAANGIAAWDGSSWSALGSGLPVNMNGRRMAVYNGELIVGNTGLTADLLVMAWDGSSWTTIKSGGLGMVLDMCEYDGELVVVGDSIVDHGSYVQAYPWIRSWDGSAWTDMSTGASDPRAIAVMDDSLYLSPGNFTSLRVWTGSAWGERSSAVFEDDEHNAAVYRMACYDGKLVLAGDFDRIDADTVFNIATWDGSSFAPITTGLTGPSDPMVMVLRCLDNRLIVGGRFTHAGGVEAANIAEWCYR